jgi:uncharacterized phage protein gp47/JayE
VLPPADGESCCAPLELPPPAPVAPFNPPGRSVLKYRIGTFTSFRRAMLSGLDAAALLPPEDESPDYQIAIIELWAYLADILTFYQERIANEAFIGTATQRASLRRLAELLGFRPVPATGAVGTVAFTIEKGKTVDLPPRFRVGSKPLPGKIAAVFETDAGLTAIGDYSAIPFATRGPIRQFAPLSSYSSFYGGSPTSQLAAANTIYGPLGSTFLTTFGFEQNAFVSTFGEFGEPADQPDAGSNASTGLTIEESRLSFSLVRTIPPSLILVPIGNTREVVLKGTSTRLQVGDQVLVISNGGSDRRLWTINVVSIDRETSTTRIRWSEPDTPAYPDSDDKVEVFALRVTASAFGHDAPYWRLLPVELTNQETATNPQPGQYPDAPFQENWDDPGARMSKLPSPGGGVLLDAIYEEAHGVTDATTTRWAVLLDGGEHKIVKVIQGAAASVSAYSLSSYVTRLQLEGGVDLDEFRLRTTTILAGSQRLEIEPNLPLGAVASGSTVILDGLYPKLAANQQVAIQGPQHGGDPADLLMELTVVQGPPVVDGHHGITTLTLKQPLTNQYARAGTTLLTNVVGVTQGETVRDEILGSGDGSAYQTLALKESPLAYLPAVDPEGLAAVDTTLMVTVNRVAWEERPSLLGASAGDQVYRTYDDEQRTHVQFGDGIEGARPPTGRDNVRARYRKGAGTHGNVAAAAVERLIDSLPGVQKVLNPVQTSGGADRESTDAIRANAPASISTFGRAISASDYAALALRYPGIGKASAVWVTRDSVTHDLVAHPYVLLTVSSPDGSDLTGEAGLLARLRAFLDGRRDPNITLRIQQATRVPIEVVAEIDVEDRYGRQATLAAASATLDPATTPGAAPGFFAFERLRFGQSVHLSELYAAIQAAEGVRAVRITTLRRSNGGGPPGTIQEHVFIQPFEIASVANDPTRLLAGRIEFALGAGGFDDV